MLPLLLLTVSSGDTAYWHGLARRVAKKIYKESKGDFYDVRLYRDSTGTYLMYHSRWYVVMPSGYKVWYRTPIALKLPDDTPDYFEDLVMEELERQASWRARIGELMASASGCGIAVVGALVAVMMSLQR